jgi:hypothetical protein
MVYGLWFMVYGSWFIMDNSLWFIMVYGLCMGFRVQDSGFRVQGPKFRV